MTSPPRDATARSLPERPFAVRLSWHGPDPRGSFRPGASLRLGAGLRTSGLLRSLPAEELGSLFFLLAFLHPNGHFHPSVPELAAAMRLSPGRARARMRRLSAFAWRGGALAFELRRESGLNAFFPSPLLFSVEAPPLRRGPAPLPPLASVPREEIVALSRERFARPREEVEQDIALRMGWDLPESGDDSEETKIRRELTRLGVPREQAESLASRHSPEAVRRQIGWLPHRRARNPAAFLAAAIEGAYEAPPGLAAADAPETPDGRTGPVAEAAS